MVPVEAPVEKIMICLPAGEWLVNSCVRLMLYQWELQWQMRRGVLLCPSDMLGSVQPLCPAHTASPAPIASPAVLQGSSPDVRSPLRASLPLFFQSQHLTVEGQLFHFFPLCDSLSDATKNCLRAGTFWQMEFFPYLPRHLPCRVIDGQFVWFGFKNPE